MEVTLEEVGELIVPELMESVLREWWELDLFIYLNLMRRYSDDSGMKRLMTLSKNAGGFQGVYRGFKVDRRSYQ